jgi:hypothetical protein
MNWKLTQMNTLPANNEEDQTDHAYIHIYQTVHSDFYTETDSLSQYTPEELSIEAV